MNYNKLRITNMRKTAAAVLLLAVSGQVYADHNGSSNCGVGSHGACVGATGATGPQGLTGLTGDKGNDGADGATGARGDTGSKGETGSQGETGLQGVQGINGVNGKDGKDGTNGVDGSDGAVGARGADGASGLNGIDGADGIAGNDGAVGPRGDKGAAGNDGVDYTATDYAAGVAAAMALALIPDGGGIGFGAGRYGNEEGYALGLTREGYKFDFTVAITHDTANQTGYGIGLKWRLGR